MNTSEVIVADVETDSLTPNVIHAVGILNLRTDEYRCYAGDDVPEGLLRLQNAALILGHNFSEYDAPAIEYLTKGLIRFDYRKIVDTLKLSRQLAPWLPSHKLAYYGELFGFPKLEQHDYSVWTPSFEIYLERDVRLNKLVFDFHWSLLSDEQETRLAA